MNDIVYADTFGMLNSMFLIMARSQPSPIEIIGTVDL